MPKFNLNWLYMIIAMMLLGLYLTNESGSASKNIPYDEFQEYVRNGYISKVTGYDDNSVEAYVKPQYVPNVFKADSSRVGKNPLLQQKLPHAKAWATSCRKKRTRHVSTVLSLRKETQLLRCNPLADIAVFCIPYRLLDIPSRRWSSGGGMGGRQRHSVSANPKPNCLKRTLR